MTTKITFLATVMAAGVILAGGITKSFAQGTDATVFSQTLFAEGDNGVHTYRIPALVLAQDGSILAFAEARHNSRSDTGDIDLVARRSTDGGKTWSDVITIWRGEGNTCGNPAPVVDRKTGRLLLPATWNHGKDKSKEIRNRTSIDTRRAYILYSDDNGVTWSEPREITASTKLDDWTWYATGPCHSIQLWKGKHKGRLVVPCNHGIFGGPSMSHVIYSDDGGETWQIGGCLESGDESTITELRNGDLMLNMRGKSDKSDNGARLVAVSHDGGETFDKIRHDEALLEPTCNASIINYSPKGKPTNTLLFSNPANEKRKDMTIKQSDDAGNTWRVAYKLSDLPAAYSDLLVLPNGDVAILYETGEKSPYESIVFTIIPASYFN